MKKFLEYSDFKYSVLKATPHDGASVRNWLNENQIPFTYRLVDDNRRRHHIKYSMTEEAHVTAFALRWL